MLTQVAHILREAIALSNTLVGCVNNFSSGPSVLLCASEQWQLNLKFLLASFGYVIFSSPASWWIDSIQNKHSFLGGIKSIQVKIIQSGTALVFSGPALCVHCFTLVIFPDPSTGAEEATLLLVLFWYKSWETKAKAVVFSWLSPTSRMTTRCYSNSSNDGDISSEKLGQDKFVTFKSIIV